MNYEQLKQDVKKLTPRQILLTLAIVTYFSLILWSLSQPNGLIMFITINIIIIIAVWKFYTERGKDAVRLPEVPADTDKKGDSKPQQ